MREHQNRDDEIVIDFKRILSAIFKKSIWIAIVSVVCAALTFGFTFWLVTPEYEATAKFYVNNNSISVGNTSVSLSS